MVTKKNLFSDTQLHRNDEGVHLQSPVLDCAPEEFYDEMSVEAVSVGEEMTLVKFRQF